MQNDEAGVADWVAVADESDLIEGEVIAAVAGGRELALYLIEGEVHATDNKCTHGDARLSEGFVMDHCIECPLHQGQFDVRTGEPLCAPVTEPIRVWPAKCEQGRVWVDLA
ncbi:MAG: non-heme iron oxygenase ferredoxin subunit [Burkholderiales bacterium]|nr:non-heme iron oxygenase ferredoxin subunit [Burkholderiales bacterium]